ncbi:hypothetical protein FACS1894159_07180 [Bacteroidia bacterium]|nr:hypothetical protein FACS1894159_07180 [Bacteroidia bacterium]
MRDEKQYTGMKTFWATVSPSMTTGSTQKEYFAGGCACPDTHNADRERSVAAAKIIVSCFTPKIIFLLLQSFDKGTQKYQ